MSSSTKNRYASKMNTYTNKQPKAKESDQQKKKKTKHQRNRKNNRCKNQRQKVNITQPSNHLVIGSTHRWTWKTTNTNKFSMRQKRELFKGHSICTEIEQKKTAIFNLQSATTTLRSKDDKGNIITTTVTSPNTSSSSESSNTIKSLENKIQYLHHQLHLIKKSERNIYHQRIKIIKQVNHNQGSYIRRRISNIISHLNSFIQHLQQRIQLIPQNTTLLLKLQVDQSRHIQLQQERERLNSTNKVHNFTNHDLPGEFVTLLNKGTNFIPTTDPCNVHTLKRTINEEVNSTLCQSIKTANSTSKLKTKSSKPNHRYRPYSKQCPTKLLIEQQCKPNFNFHLIDYVLNTIQYSKEYLQLANLRSLLRTKQLNTTPALHTHIHNFSSRTDIILTKTDKNMGWALVPISWFNDEYTRHLKDTTTYRRIDNFNFSTTISNSNKLLTKLKKRFDKLYKTSTDLHLLTTSAVTKFQLPYMKLLPKVHKLKDLASATALPHLTGRPIITAHSWITSNPSRLLGQELDKLILQLKNLFTERKITFPLLYNSFDLLDELQAFTINDIKKYTLTTFDFTSLYTNISHPDTIHAIINTCKLLDLPNSYRDLLLNLNDFINNKNFFVTGSTVYQQIKGVAMGSYHSRQIADLVLLMCELEFFTNNETTGLFIFRRYIDDGFMLTDATSLNKFITSLSSAYPTQIPITFTSNCHSTHYLDLTISLNYYTMAHRKIHYQIYQKPHHKYMYPHFSSNHPHHVFTGIIKTETTRHSRLSATIDDYKFIRQLFSYRLNNLDYPDNLIRVNSYPWLPFRIHKNWKTRGKFSKNSNSSLIVYYRTKYNKHLRTDKIVQGILRKYHNLHIPKLSKAYCNTTKLHSMLLTNKTLHSKLIRTSVDIFN